MSKKVIPADLFQDRYWKPVLYLFQENGKLSQCFTTKYFDLEGRTIKIRPLKAASKGWSESEKFMLNLALHLFNEQNKLPNGLGDMDYLDDYNKKLAFEAMALRFGG